MKQRKQYEDDDGRTIADMGDVSSPSLFTFRREAPRENREPSPNTERTPNESPFTPEERRIYVFAALKASLLIAAAFIVGLGLAILLMILLWT